MTKPTLFAAGPVTSRALTVHVTLERGAHGVDVCRWVADKLGADHDLDHIMQPEAPPPDELVSVRSGRDGRGL